MGHTMKLLVIFGLITCITALTDSEQWAQFKATYKKSYRSTKVEAVKFNTFKSNLQKINKHNENYSKGETTYFMRVNQYSDLSPEEFRQFLTATVPTGLNVTEKYQLRDGAPDSIDWREREQVVGVKNQGSCGACWAFAATGVTESHYTLKYGSIVALSEQNIIDCSYGNGNDGCNGGHIDIALGYIQSNGVMIESDYPYEWARADCRVDTSRLSPVRSSGYVKVDPGEDSLKAAVGTIGPIAVMINGDGIQHYGGGVFNEASCSTNQNHVVVAVGYGNQDGLDYWLSRNSWGADWGESGYFKLIRNANGQCGYAYWNYYPIIA